MKNISNCQDGCTTVGSQKAKICLPVSIIPYAVTSPAIVNCCGETEVGFISDECTASEATSCEFVISQVINVDVPVEFGASVKIGETYIQCAVTGECTSCLDAEIEDEDTELQDEFHHCQTQETDEYDAAAYVQDQDDPYLGA